MMGRRDKKALLMMRVTIAVVSLLGPLAGRLRGLSLGPVSPAGRDKVAWQAWGWGGWGGMLHFSAGQPSI